jgi:hypothetical protein
MAIPSVSGKLSLVQFDVVCELFARGFSPKAIRAKMREGARINHVDVTPVTLTVSAIRQRLAGTDGRKLVHAHRLRLFGDVYAQPLAYAGERLRVIAGLVSSAQTDLAAARKPIERARIRAEVRAHVVAAETIAKGAAVDATITRESDGASTITASGSLDSLAAELDSLARAGVVVLPKAASDAAG